MKGKISILRSITVMLMAVYLAVATSCNHSELQVSLSLTNARCPIDLGLAGSMESIKLEKENVVATIKMNEQFVNIKAMGQSNDVIANAIIKSMLLNDDEKKLLQTIADENIGLKYIIIGDQSGQKTTIQLSTEQIKSALNASTSPHELLLNLINSTKIQLPMTVDVVTTLKDLTIEGENVVYIYNIDENQVNMDDAEKNINNLKANTVENTKRVINDVAAGQFFQTVIKDGKNVCYRYIGNKTNKTVEFVITHNELLEILSNTATYK
ncbi:MAG: hypothetical protein IJ911_09930 [Salinivirgaceae bacterium]|nr:hypothetical protein [Salinivirgaceae bacterium]